MSYPTYQNNSVLDYRLKIIKFLTPGGHENGACCATTFGFGMMTITMQNQHLADERLDYSATQRMDFRDVHTQSVTSCHRVSSDHLLQARLLT